MFWKSSKPTEDITADPAFAADIVTRASGIYVEFNDDGQLVRPRSSLPRPWFVVRQCFMIAYEAECRRLTDEVKNSYRHVYGELAFFVDDRVHAEFNWALADAVRKHCEEANKIGGANVSEDFARRFIASDSVKVSDRQQIFSQVYKRTKSCRHSEQFALASVLSFCAETYRSLMVEWDAFTELIEFKRLHSLL